MEPYKNLGGNGTVKTSDALKVQDMSFDSGNDAILKVAADATADGGIVFDHEGARSDTSCHLQ